MPSNAALNGVLANMLGIDPLAIEPAVTLFKNIKAANSPSAALAAAKTSINAAATKARVDGAPRDRHALVHLVVALDKLNGAALTNALLILNKLPTLVDGPGAIADAQAAIVGL